MCSKNQKVGHLIRPIHNKSLFDSENFSTFAKFVFSEQTTFTQKNKTEQDLYKERTCSVFYRDIQIIAKQLP